MTSNVIILSYSIALTLAMLGGKKSRKFLKRRDGRQKRRRWFSASKGICHMEIYAEYYNWCTERLFSNIWWHEHTDTWFCQGYEVHFVVFFSVGERTNAGLFFNSSRRTKKNIFPLETAHSRNISSKNPISVIGGSYAYWNEMIHSWRILGISMILMAMGNAQNPARKCPVEPAKSYNLNKRINHILLVGSLFPSLEQHQYKNMYLTKYCELSKNVFRKMCYRRWNAHVVSFSWLFIVYS